jgi:hypothetical protein
LEDVRHSSVLYVCKYFVSSIILNTRKERPDTWLVSWLFFVFIFWVRWLGHIILGECSRRRRIAEHEVAMTRAAPSGNGAAFCGGANTVCAGVGSHRVHTEWQRPLSGVHKEYTESGNGRFLAYTKSTHRVATAAFGRTFHHEGKISPGWWGGVQAHPLSLYLPSPVKLTV